jgi:hypothetical protein
MTNTERKLDEARYFLGQLDVEDPYFDYILSAYLNAARSTPWVMRNEFTHVDGWNEWYGGREGSKEEKEIFKAINDLRIKATKQEGIKTNYFLFDAILVDEEYYSTIKEFLKKDGRYKITITKKEELNDTADEEVNVDDSDVDNDSDFDDEIDDSDFDDGDFSGKTYVIKGRKDSTIDQSKNSRLEIHNLCKDYFALIENLVQECMARFQKQQ